MFTLTEQEVELLLKSADPVVVTATKKLKEAEEKGEFIPKSRFQKELDEKKTIEKQLAEIQSAQQKADEDKARKNGELDKLLQARDTELATVKSQLEVEKKDADQFRSLLKKTRETVKKQLGDDKWLPEYEVFSIESLSKIAGQTFPLIGTINASGKPSEVPSDVEQLKKELAEATKSGNRLKVVTLGRQLFELQHQT